VSEKLSESEFTQLLYFLRHRRGQNRQTQNHKLLRQNVAEMLERFYSTEVQLSGEGRERLANPAGPEDADLGVILHVQSEDDTIDSFWDPRSATMRLLKDKGVEGSFCFGFDWHWRAQGRFTGKPGCPTSTWSKELRSLHDQFSMDLLEYLPLPFVVTASSCTRERLRKSLGASARALDIVLDHPVAIRRFDLDFRHDGLRRIILHVHHPISGFYASPTNKPAMALQLDAGINFILWLLGRTHSTTTFRDQYSLSGCPRFQFKGFASLRDMWRYIQKEREEGKKLRLEDYSPNFLNWASRYLGRVPADVLASGESLASVAASSIRENMSASHQKRLLSNKHPAIAALTMRAKNVTPENLNDAESPTKTPVVRNRAEWRISPFAH